MSRAGQRGAGAARVAQRGAGASGAANGRRAILLMGPTGSGKSDLAMRIAETLPVEIVSVDSALVYRGMDIGTAKPDAALRSRVAHHLIDIRDPTESYSAGEFARDALRAMQDIWQRGRQPLLVGGTMLYFHALTHGIAELPAADLEVRADIDAQAASSGWAAVHRELERVDPAAAARIHVNDPQRIQRALEVHRLTGETITRLQQKRVSVFADAEVTEFALAPLERRNLHTRIEVRFGAMLEAGLLGEVRTLYERGDLTAEHPSMRAVGYRQLWRHLAGQCALDEAGKQAIAATRQLAKRQLTWLRRRERAQWFDSMHPQVARMMMDALCAGGFPASSGVTPQGALC
ncbi:MAG TPA: tRNA (adenosine(37)-N6)-dimethylallyltransferase MiaA [Steroidobacteraceae bacterium]|nr:tRNA (adenosine(37)-N6)-dimethylallyltransferase MiaA [Steroidobacteraceae bacterium]